MIILSDQKRQLKPIRHEIDEAVKRVLDSGWYILGKELDAFEKAFGRYCDNGYAIGVGSGTEALHLSLVDAGIKTGDEVITVANTAMPTVSAITFAGAEPVFVDIDKDSYLMDTSKVEELISKKTKAIIPVHLYGQSVNMDYLLELSKKYNIKIIEDACQASGSMYKNKKVGSIGDYGCFSFYPTKNLGAIGDGGAIVVKDKDKAERLKMLRNYGQSKRYYHDTKGFNSRLDEIQAAVLNVKLKYLDCGNKRRRELADLYKQELKDTDIILPKEEDWAYHIYHLFVIRIKNRDKIIEKLKENDIHALIHYPVSICSQKAYPECKCQEERLQNTIDASKEILSLPLYPELTNEEVLMVVESCKILNSRQI